MKHRFTRRQALKSGAIVIGGVVVASPFVVKGAEALFVPNGGAEVADAAGPLPWSAANDILTATTVPTFASRTFDITKSPYNAKGNGKTDNTGAFQSAIADCNAAGGGQVIVPSGTFLTGAIYLKSNVNLHLNAGSTLKFSGDASKYPVVLTRYEGIECMNHSPMIYAHGEQNIALTGSGTLDISGTSAWNKGSDRAGILDPMVAKGIPPDKRIVTGELRSTSVEPYSCTNVLIQGVTLVHSVFWQLHPTLCKNVTVDGVTTNVSGANTDGCDPECCDHVVIKNSTIMAGDDNIAIKSGRDADGRRINTPCQNIVIWNNVFQGPWGAITLGSELTGGIQNVYAFSNKTTSSGTRYMHYVKSNTLRGGFARNINIDTFHGSHLSHDVIFITMSYNGQTGSFPPDFSGPFNLNHITVDTAPRVVDDEGISSDHVGPLNLSNSTFTNITHSSNTISDAPVHFSHVTINGKFV